MQLLWMVLEKHGVFDLLLEMIKTFHQEIEARSQIDREPLERTEVRNGLRQGCTVVPTLFNLYVRVMKDRWLEK